MRDLDGKIIDGVVVLTPVARHGTTSFVTLGAVIDLYLNQGKKVFVLDLREIQSADDASIAVMFSEYQKIRDAGGELILCSLQDSVKQTLYALNLHMAFDNVFSTLDTALAMGRESVPASVHPKKMVGTITLERLGTGNLDFAAHLHKAFEEMFTRDVIPYCILDFADITQITAMQLRAIITLITVVRDRKGDVVFCNVGKNVMSILVICKLSTVTELFQSLEQAQQHFDARLTAP